MGRGKGGKSQIKISRTSKRLIDGFAENVDQKRKLIEQEASPFLHAKIDNYLRNSRAALEARISKLENEVRMANYCSINHNRLSKDKW